MKTADRGALVWALMAAGLSLAAPAQATLINFNTYSGDSTFNTGEYFDDSGFRFKRGPTGQMGTYTGCTGGCATNGSRFFFIWGTTSLLLSRVDGGAFAFDRFDLAEGSSGNPGWWAHSLQIIGTTAEGGTVNTSVALDLINDGAGSGVDFQTVLLSPLFSNVVQVELRGAGGTVTNDFALDNLRFEAPVTSAIPEPSALAGLLGAGLYSLVWRGRSRRKGR